jgi:hypothetical protein
MAILKTKGLSGRLGDVVMKQYADKTVVTAMPDRSRKPPSELQLLHREAFKRARRRASMDKGRKEVVAACRPYLKRGQSVYHFLVGVYRRQEKRRMLGEEATEVDLGTLLRQEYGEGRKREVAAKKEGVVLELSHGVTLAHRTTEERGIVVYRVSYGAWVSTSTEVRSDVVDNKELNLSLTEEVENTTNTKKKKRRSTHVFASSVPIYFKKAVAVRRCLPDYAVKKEGEIVFKQFAFNDS